MILQTNWQRPGEFLPHSYIKLNRKGLPLFPIHMEVEGPRRLTSFWPKITLCTPVATNGKKMANCRPISFEITKQRKKKEELKNY